MLRRPMARGRPAAIRRRDWGVAQVVKQKRHSASEAYRSAATSVGQLPERDESSSQTPKDFEASGKLVADMGQDEVEGPCCALRIDNRLKAASFQSHWGCRGAMR